MQFFKDLRDKIGDKFILLIFIVIFILGIILVVIGNNLSNNESSRENIVNDDVNYYISLIGDDEITLYQGEEYIEPGYKAANSRGRDLTSEVVVDNQVNTNILGEYTINYILNNTVKTRIIKVIEKPIGATFIHLNGDLNIYLNKGDKYNEPGYEVVDTIDGGKLRDKVEITSNIDMNKVGSYKIIYSVVNSSGVTTNKTRTVTVMDSEISLTLDNENYTNKDVGINVYINDIYFEYMILPNGDKITNNTYTYKVSDNGSYKFIVYNNKGGSKEAVITIHNINKSNPSGSCSGSYKDGVSTINVKANDDIGIEKYVINGQTYTNSPIKITEELKNVAVAIYDKAGNTASLSCNLEDKNVYGDFSNISSYKPKAITKNISVNYYKPSSGTGFTYWAYLPDKVTANLPIILYMPGLGERGNDYSSNAKTAIANGPIHEVYKYGYAYNAIIIHVQVAGDRYVYEYLSSYIELLNKIATEFNANKKKISVMGFSHGCYGVMNIMANHQKYFSATVPIGCEPKDRASYFTSTPTWAFAGAGEGVNSFPGFVNQINNMGGYAKFTRPSYHNHNILNDTYSILRDDNYKVIDWMISQTRK